MIVVAEYHVEYWVYEYETSFFDRFSLVQQEIKVRMVYDHQSQLKRSSNQVSSKCLKY